MRTTALEASEKVVELNGTMCLHSLTYEYADMSRAPGVCCHRYYSSLVSLCPLGKVATTLGCRGPRASSQHHAWTVVTFTGLCWAWCCSRGVMASSWLRIVPFTCPYIALTERGMKNQDPCPTYQNKKTLETSNLGFVLGFMTFVRFAQLMAATSGSGSTSGPTVIKGGLPG